MTKSSLKLACEQVATAMNWRCSKIESKRPMLLTCIPPEDRRCRRHIGTLTLFTRLASAITGHQTIWREQRRTKTLKNACHRQKRNPNNYWPLHSFSLLIFSISVAIVMANRRASPLRSEEFFQSSSQSLKFKSSPAYNLWVTSLWWTTIGFVESPKESFF